VLPATIFPWIPVPELSSPDAAKSTLNLARDGFQKLFAELRALIRRREVLLTLLLFTAPTGSFALTNQLGGVSKDFHASPAFVGRIGGLVLSLAGATACLLLPVFARWIRSLPLYLLIGTAGSLFTLSLLMLPRTPITFAVAFLGENVVQALSFTAAVAICFSTIGRNNPLAATQFSLLTSATVIPILYMGVLDGQVYDTHGLSRMYLVDGGLSIAACALTAIVMWRFSRSTNDSLQTV
jgi:PAT family beta-lactamase induction signal transducer AmpG